MAALCYVCDVGISAKPGGIATNQPQGVCGICGVMACEGHSKREPNRPRFECVICIPIVAAVSGAMQSQVRTPLAERFTNLLTTVGGEEWLVKSVEDFLQRYPEFAAWLDRLPEVRQRAELGYRTDDTEVFYSSLGSGGRDLVLLAVVMILGLQIPTRILPEPLRRMMLPWQ